MSTPRWDELAARLLVRAQKESDEPRKAGDRAAAITLIEDAIRRRQARRQAWRGAMLVAAAVLLGLGTSRFAMRREAGSSMANSPLTVATSPTVVGHPSGNVTTMVEQGAAVAMVDGVFLAAGSRIRAQSNSAALLSLSTGTQLMVEEDSDVSIVGMGARQVFAIRRGSLRANVAKLDGLTRFIVQTPDAEVEVRGTSFRVAVTEPDPDCGEGSVTRVIVDEGVVAVRFGGGEARVSAGQSWPAACVSAPPGAVTPPAGSGAAKTDGRRAALGARPKAARLARVMSAEEASELAEQNDAFAVALAAKRRGAVREASQAFEAFISRYPSSPLVEDAAAQRMHLLRSIDRQRAVTAAQQYLAAYPNGFARAEAEAVARQQP